jgi:tetratricopeptide (TPR) repeat protein
LKVKEAQHIGLKSKQGSEESFSCELIISASLCILTSEFNNLFMKHFSGVRMKQNILLTIILVLLASVSFMGFQCGSAESTSAKLYIQRGDLAAAEKSLTTDVEKNPTNPESWYLLGDVRRQRSNYKGMLEAFDKSLKAGASTETQGKINDAKKYIWGTSLNSGVLAFNRSNSGPKDSAQMYREMAINSYTSALMVNPDSMITYQNMAIVQHAQGNTDEEIKYLKEAISRKKDPQLSTYLINAYVGKAEEARKANNTQEATTSFNSAIAELQEARKASPNNPELLSTLINVFIEAGRASDALPYIKEAVAKDPSNKVFQNDLGLLLMQTNNINEAVDHFNAAIATDSMFTDALRNGAVALMKQGQKMKDDATEKADAKKGTVDKSYQAKFVQASKLLQKYLSIKPDDGDVWQALATAYGGAGMIKQAGDALKKADSLNKK